MAYKLKNIPKSKIPAEYKEDYDNVVLISDNFTTNDSDAIEIDNMVYDILVADGVISNTPKPKPASKPKPKPAAKPKPATKPKPAAKPKSTTAKSKIEKLQESLEETIRELSEGGGSIDPDEVRAIVKEMLAKHKVTYDMLEARIQEMLNTVTKIQIDIPGAPTVPFDPSEKNENYQKIIDDLLLGHAVMLIGGAGTGKTFMAEEISTEALGRKYVTINCSQWTSPIEILGGETIEGFKEGKLIEAWRDGKILILDELPKIDPNTAGLLNEALAKIKEKPGGKDQFINGAGGKMYKKHKDFGVIATGNVYPNTDSVAYGANNKQDLSLLDRFAGSVYFINKNPKIEQEIVKNEGIWRLFNQLRTVIEDNNYEAQVSLRIMQVARDTFNLEMNRVKKGGALDPNQGKTLKGVVDSFLSTFSATQVEALKRAISYDRLIANYEYRKMYSKS